MRSYQSVLILKPDFDEPQVDEALASITGLIQNHGGACLKVDKWGKKRLSYRVKKNRFGYYLNIYHTCENEQVPALEAKYKLFAPIIKFMVLRLDDKELERAMGGGEEKAGEEKAGEEKAGEDGEAATPEAEAVAEKTED